MADPAPIPIESRVTAEPRAAESGNGAAGRGASSSRVVHEPGRWSRVVAVVAVLGLVAGGLVWALPDGDPAPSTPAAGADDEPRDTPGDLPAAATRAAFAEALLRFGEIESFAYRGSVRGAGASPLRAGPWIAGEVDVEGAVILSRDLARDVAVDANDRWVETLRSGGTVWRRSAPNATALAGAPWDGRVAMAGEDWLDAATVAYALRTAGDPRGEAPDAAGRRVIRATLRERELSNSPAGPFPGADVLFSVDDAGDIVHVQLLWPGFDPLLVVDLDISGHDEPQDIAPPDTGPAALRRTVPVDALQAAGVRPLEL